jgi:pyruvate,water dikinase
MFWFGKLKSDIAKLKNNENENLHNDLLCGSSDIISTQPIHRSFEIAQFIKSSAEATNLFNEDDDQFIYHVISQNKNFSKLNSLIQSYLSDFGERCVGELKLETKSFTTHPASLIKIIKSYLKMNTSIDSSIDKKLRHEAEATLEKVLEGNPLKKIYIYYVLNKTRELVSNRENLRYERSRGFGIVRMLFNKIGEKFYDHNFIESPEDIFYLTREEIIAFKEGRTVSQNLKSIIANRKSEFEAYKNLPSPPERITTTGIVYNFKNQITHKNNNEIIDELKGIGCSPGKVIAEVEIVNNPNDVESLNGKILVTHSTDPGWVILFPSAAAIIVERGSLLSHSAIVSREMGKPCIVGVTGLLSQLHSGDLVEMDGRTGLIKIIKRASTDAVKELIK